MIPDEMGTMESERLLLQSRCPLCLKMLTHIFKFQNIYIFKCGRGCFHVHLVDTTTNEWTHQLFSDIPIMNLFGCPECQGELKILKDTCEYKYLFCFDCGSLYHLNKSTDVITKITRDNWLEGYKNQDEIAYF